MATSASGRARLVKALCRLGDAGNRASRHKRGARRNSYVSTSNGTVNTFIGSDTSSYGIVGTLSNHALGLRANNALAVSILPDGKVGIGTTAPSEKLDVSGNANVTGNFNATGTITGGTIHAKYQDVAEWVESSQSLAPAQSSF